MIKTKYRYGDRTVEKNGDFWEGRGGDGLGAIYFREKKDAMVWLQGGMPYELKTYTTGAWYVGEVHNRETGKMVSRLTVHPESSSPEDRNAAWAQIQEWAMKYGLGS
jgi:hypothetical protein